MDPGSQVPEGVFRPQGKIPKGGNTMIFKEGAFGGALSKQWFLAFAFFLQTLLIVIHNPLYPGITFPDNVTLL